jgi:hypothetical protein
MEAPTQSVEEGRTLALLWTGILAGPLAWAFDEVVGYSATAHECSTGHMFLLHSLTVGGLLVCAAGLLCGWTAWTHYRLSNGSPPNGRLDRIRAMAIAGMALSSAFALVIIATQIPKWILSPCD